MDLKTKYYHYLNKLNMVLYDKLIFNMDLFVYIV